MAEKLDLDEIERIARQRYETGGRLTANPKTIIALIARIRELECAQHAGEAVAVRSGGFRDCIDAVKGAMAFGQQNVNLPPEGHWLEEFWDMGRRIAAVPEGWQPIETAPKTDRTLLLGYPNRAGNWRTVRGQWMSEEYIGEYWEDPDMAEPGWYETAEEADDECNCWAIAPTHWMPLPAAPAAAPQDREGQ